MIPNNTVADKGKAVVASLVLAISASSAGFVAWKVNEGFTSEPVIPVQGDVPTIGHGSTYYEDGTRVTMKDVPISKERGEQLALFHMKSDGWTLVKSLPQNAMLHPVEFDIYMDFLGQYGEGAWRRSSMRRELAAGNPVASCEALLKYRFVQGYDCSTMVNGRRNTRCWGVWTRQQDRYTKCMGVQ